MGDDEREDETTESKESLWLSIISSSNAAAFLAESFTPKNNGYSMPASLLHGSTTSLSVLVKPLFVTRCGGRSVEEFVLLLVLVLVSVREGVCRLEAAGFNRTD